MNKTSLDQFAKDSHAEWGPLTSELVESCVRSVKTLLGAAETEDWLRTLLEEAPESRELYRDAAHGFVLLGHVESAGLYRPPHDHGMGWVIYAVQRGETEMRTYARVHDEEGRVRLVKRDATILRAGDVGVYLPGDIHDTRCLSSSLLLYRFTSRDLKQERVTRYAQRNGIWTDGVS
ncbi:MAG: hypothetical protein U0174_03335 [Polyangiaceae bacterium]